MQQNNGLMLGVDASLHTGDGAPTARLSGNAIRFYSRSVQNHEKSAAEGRPIFEPREYIEIMVPGDKTNVVNRPVSEADRRQYAQQYAAWKAGNAEQVVGTPLAQWPLIAREQVLELEHFKCRTVEQLAGMSDANLGNVGPFRALREQAKAYLEAARGAAPLAQAQEEIRRLKEENAALQQQLGDLGRALQEKARKEK